jgi:hypothetical protein
MEDIACGKSLDKTIWPHGLNRQSPEVIDLRRDPTFLGTNRKKMVWRIPSPACLQSTTA